MEESLGSREMDLTLLGLGTVESASEPGESALATTDMAGRGRSPKKSLALILEREGGTDPRWVFFRGNDGTDWLTLGELSAVSLSSDSQGLGVLLLDLLGAIAPMPDSMPAAVGFLLFLLVVEIGLTGRLVSGVGLPEAVTDDLLLTMNLLMLV